MERPKKEELANTLTHGVATILAIGAAVAMVIRAGHTENGLLIASCTVYGIALAAVFFCSAMSHRMQSQELRRRYRKLDQAFIYLLIVSTYTPFSIIYLNATLWWLLLGAMWLVAITGFVSKLFLAHRVDSVSIAGYVALGWMPAMGGLPLSRTIPSLAVWGIVAGGVLYTIGTAFLFNDKRVWYYHAIWHLFVVAGAGVHWWVTMTFVITR